MAVNPIGLTALSKFEGQMAIGEDGDFTLTVPRYVAKKSGLVPTSKSFAQYKYSFPTRSDRERRIRLEPVSFRRTKRGGVISVQTIRHCIRIQFQGKQFDFKRLSPRPVWVHQLPEGVYEIDFPHGATRKLDHYVPHVEPVNEIATDVTLIDGGVMTNAVIATRKILKEVGREEAKFALQILISEYT